MQAAIALQKAIHAALGGDPALTGLIGEGRIHDLPPRGAQPPYILIRAIACRPAGAAELEHHFELELWSPGRSRALTAAMAEAAAQALETPGQLEPPTTLANLELLETQIFPADRNGNFRVLMRLRALTEQTGQSS